MTNLNPAADAWTVSHNSDGPGPNYMLTYHFESGWLPVIGPTAMCLLRYCAHRLILQGAFTIQPFDLALQVGQCKPSRHMPFAHALERAEKRHLIRIDSAEHFTLLPTAPLNQGLTEAYKTDQRARWDAGLAEKEGTH